MSTKTSHRRARKARGENLDVFVDRCDDCSNPAPEPRRFGDLLLCTACREARPAQQPWVLDPETGGPIHPLTGKPVAFTPEPDDEDDEPPFARVNVIYAASRFRR